MSNRLCFLINIPIRYVANSKSYESAEIKTFEITCNKVMARTEKQSKLSLMLIYVIFKYAVVLKFHK